MRETVLFLAVGMGTVATGCGSSPMALRDTFGSDASAGFDSGSGSGGGTPTTPTDDGGGTSLLGNASYDGSTAVTTTGDPQTCDEAAQQHSYVGCEYWPTVVANNVWSIFDFAVVVANAGQTTANVTVTGPSNTNLATTVPPGQLAKIFLPWVPALKGPDADVCGSSTPLAASIKAAASAFHLMSTVPVTVYQFNALEYAGKGGPAGKNWSSCPGNGQCIDPTSPNYMTTSGCFSFTNDASLLLPTAAMTQNYRVAGHEGTTLITRRTSPPQTATNDAYFAVTATQPATTVTVKLSGTAQIAGGGGIVSAAPGGTLTFTLNAGDVAELAGTGGSDLSGSLVQATAPVQVITGMPCVSLPPLAPACDHIEEAVFPAETMGKDYVVTRPAGPNGDAVGHQVRIYGNVDGTRLTYNPAPPPGCPTTINAGQVVECGSPPCPQTIDVNQTVGQTCGITTADFEVQGDQPFMVGTFTLGATIVDAVGQVQGDPAQSFATAVEQYRSKYYFLAPDDYTVSYVDVVAKAGTTITLDNQMVSARPQVVGTSGFAIERVKLGPGQAGAHVLSASQRVGIQVVGYGQYTSYMYPGGLDLAHIAAAPPPIR